MFDSIQYAHQGHPYLPDGRVKKVKPLPMVEVEGPLEEEGRAIGREVVNGGGVGAYDLWWCEG